MIINSSGLKVTVDNFCRAETDTYFARHVKDAGGRFMSMIVVNQDHYEKRVT